MSVAEQTAVPNLSNFFSKLRCIIPSEVMGILIVMAVPMPAMIMDLLTGRDITLSIIAMLVLVYILQPVHFSGLPSLPLIFASLQCLLWTGVSLFCGAEGKGAAGNVGQPFGQFAVEGKFLLGFTVVLALIVSYSKGINYSLMDLTDLIPDFTAGSRTPDFSLSRPWLANHGDLGGIAGDRRTNLAHNQKMIWIQG
jgi:hypothetical protein